MFNFLNKKKKIDANKIKAFDSAISAIDVFISLSDWISAKRAIEEISFKEKKALNNFLENFNDENITVENKKLIEKERKQYEIKENKILILKNKLEKLEDKYIKNAEIERFKIRFHKIKAEIDILIGMKNPMPAMNLLQKFLEENKENSTVINFYNKEKKLIHTSIEKKRKIEQEKLKKNARNEAMQLIGETSKIIIDTEKNGEEEKIGFFNIKNKLNFYKNLKENIKRKKLLDEINILIEEDSRINNELAEKKLENIHKGLVKEINKHKVIGYDLYGKILGADKISGDTFGLEESEKKYNFFIGDATGHGIRAGFIITLINKFFRDNFSKNLKELAFEINNGLKQDLKSRNFVTGVFFEVDKESNDISFVGMGHEPMFIYRKDSNSVEKVIPGGLAAGIRLIKDINDIKVKKIILNDGDILITYSDGIVENKNMNGEYYGLEKLEKSFKMVAEYEPNIKNIYDYLINDVKIFRGGTNFDDDVSVILLKRDKNKDIVAENDEFITDLKTKEGLDNTEIKTLKGKSKEEIEEVIESIRRKKELKRIIKILDNLYYTGEILKLKEEATRFIKEGYIDPKINFYLRKAINNEKKYRIEQKNQKIRIKYSILNELYKKGDYSTVIKEVEEIISKDGNI